MHCPYCGNDQWFMAWEEAPWTYGRWMHETVHGSNVSAEDIDYYINYIGGFFTCCVCHEAFV